MPFEQAQTFRKSYSARKKKKKRSNKGGWVEEKLQDIQLFLLEEMRNICADVYE